MKTYNRPPQKKTPTQDPLHFAQPMARSKPRRSAFPLIMLLGILAIIAILEGIFIPRFIDQPTTPNLNLPPKVPAHTGPLITAPLNTEQIYALHHLINYMQYKQLASLYVAHMTLDEELGQLIMVEYNDTSYSSDLDTMLTKYHAGGVIMYEFQMLSFAQTKHDIATMQARAKIPLLVSADEEGGPYVHRLIHIYPPNPAPTSIFQTGNVNLAAQDGRQVAQELLALGINEDLGPDVDVNLYNGPDEVTRTWGYTPQDVIKFAGAYMQALQGAGAIACIKHFPGLGDATTDAHFDLPVVKRTKDQLYAVELAPFKAFIQAQNKLLYPGMIMPTDVLMPAIDPKLPAELSHIFMTDILRKQFGYDGVALTDALYMRGISQTWSMPEAAVLALNAGNDMLLGPTDTDQMVAMLDGLKAALQNGTLSKARVDEAATRIIALKMASHLMPATLPV